MNSGNLQNDPDFSWSDFEHLEELEQFQQDLEQLTIPDATYRQLKELNQALIGKANKLAEEEQELERQRKEFELARNHFNAIRLQSTQETTESRLQRLVRMDQKKNLGEALEPDIDFVEIVEQDPNQIGKHIAVESEAITQDPLSIGRVPNEEELTRFQKSARELREKSEVISAVFIELDQMVRDLNRQQELLDDLKVNQNSPSACELSIVNDKLKRRFQRLTKQIQVR